MPRWAWFLPVALLVVGAGLVGFRYGYLAARITENDAITTYAARYLEAVPSGTITDCWAEPDARRAVWLVVICRETADRLHLYHVSRFGGLLDYDLAPARPLRSAAPEA